MTAPLFTDRDPCGCERALGHVCCPPWMDENEWPGEALRPAKLQGCDAKMEGTDLHRSAPNRELGHYPAGASINATEERDRMRDHTAIPTSVYRYYDRFDVLIYVGVTSRRTSRQREHNLDKYWWRYVDHQTVEHYDTRPEALIREASLIHEFRPPFNTQHNPDSERGARIYVAFRESMQEPSPWSPGKKHRVNFVPFERGDNGKMTVIRSASPEVANEKFVVATGLKASSDKRKYGRVVKAWMHGPFIFMRIQGATPPLVSAFASLTFRKKDSTAYVESLHVVPEYHVPRVKKAGN